MVDTRLWGFLLIRYVHAAKNNAEYSALYKFVKFELKHISIRITVLPFFKLL